MHMFEIIAENGPMSTTRNPQVFSVKMRMQGLPRSVLKGVKQAIDRLLGFDRFNTFYRGLPACEPLDFSRTFLEAMNVRLDFARLPADTIPASGPLLVVANHAFGVFDGFLLDALLLSRRPDVRLMAIYHLAAIPEWRDRFIWVDQKSGRRSRQLNMQSWRKCFHWLSQGGALAIFPAGRVARFELRHLSVTERPWNSHIGAMARRANVPVLPVFFEGHNAWPYQLAGFLCPPLQDLLLVNEAANKQGWRLRVSIGPLIQPNEFSNFATDEAATQFMRQRVAMLSPPHSNWN
jgi:putative hemolysin